MDRFGTAQDESGPGRMDRFMDRFNRNAYKYARAGHGCHSATHLPRSQTPEPATTTFIMPPTQSKLITRQDAAATAASLNHFETFTAAIIPKLRWKEGTPDGDVYAGFDFVNLCNNKGIKDPYGRKTFDRIMKANASKFSPRYEIFEGEIIL